MGTVTANSSMSLDGFGAGLDDAVGPLFDWYSTGQVPLTMPGDHRAARTMISRAGADFFGRVLADAGSIVTGRRLFDLTEGWGGAHPVGAPVFVVTYEVPEYCDPGGPGRRRGHPGHPPPLPVRRNG